MSNIRSVKEATKPSYEAHKREMAAQADELRAAGFVFRGNSRKSFNEQFARWLPVTDFWSKPNVAEGQWVTRQTALESLK